MAPSTKVKLKRAYKTYSQSTRKEILKYVKLTNINEACKAFGVPKSTIHTWLKQEHSKYRFLKNLGWAGVITAITLVGLAGTAVGVCYLSGGPEEAKFMWRFIWDLLRQAGRLSL